jgi:hypothetical protein
MLSKGWAVSCCCPPLPPDCGSWENEHFVNLKKKRVWKIQSQNRPNRGRFFQVPRCQGTQDREHLAGRCGISFIGSIIWVRNNLKLWPRGRHKR